MALLFFCLLFGGMGLVANSFFRQPKDEALVLGDRADKRQDDEDSNDYDVTRGASFFRTSRDAVQPSTEQIKDSPIEIVTTSIEPTVVVTVAPTDEIKITKQNEETHNSQLVLNLYRTEKSVDLVSVTERSVTTNSNYVIPVVTKSVLKVIQNKIEQAGRGEIISKPTPSPTVVLSPGAKMEAGDVLSGDVDVFYKLMGSQVLLGAENSEGRQLKIKDGDLRSAEITLNKVLDKKNLRLSVTSNNDFALVEGSVIALTTMPIHVNIDSHKVFLETNEGKKELKILPEQAIKQAVGLKSFEKLNADSLPSIESFGEELSYKVVGDKTYKVFGFIKAKAKQNVYIAAESGEVTEGVQPLMTRIIRLISL